MSRLNLFCIFHLNLAYSSIEEDQHQEVIDRCYWPLLKLIQGFPGPFGIEATGFTLERVQDLQPAWISELKRLLQAGSCEFIGSGYTQIIGPLVPARLNSENLHLGNGVYQNLLGLHPQLGLVNEQAYSSGLVQHYVEAGYQALFVEWDNASSLHPEWKKEWRYLPQYALDQQGLKIPLFWNHSIAFQKFQRYVHGELELDEYSEYLGSHLSGQPRALALYGNDAEIFDFRPNRYLTEAPLPAPREWDRLERLFAALQEDRRFELLAPGRLLDWLDLPEAGNELRLECAAQPVPVKKQRKYNLTRWAVTGRDDLGINTRCWRIYEALSGSTHSGPEDWKRLCYLWSSDFRTHITRRRWRAYLRHLSALEKDTGVSFPATGPASSVTGPHSPQQTDGPAENGSVLTLRTGQAAVQLNCRRGLSIKRLWLGDLSGPHLCGTLAHGYYDDIGWSADWYTGHAVFDRVGMAKLTDLHPVTPRIRQGSEETQISGNIETDLGVISKHWRIKENAPSIELEYALQWPTVPQGSLRIAHVTLNPEAFVKEELFFRTSNGGLPERFDLNGRAVDHGASVSFLVSASHALGITEGRIDIGDRRKYLRIEVDKSLSALIGMVTFQTVPPSYFCRLAFSMAEMDETSRGVRTRSSGLRCRLRITRVDTPAGDEGRAL